MASYVNLLVWNIKDQFKKLKSDYLPLENFNQTTHFTTVSAIKYVQRITAIAAKYEILVAKWIEQSEME